MDKGYIIASDPGVTTGICVFEYLGGFDYRVEESFLIPWESRYQMHRDLFQFVPISALIFERFRLYPDSASGQAYSEFEAVQSAEIFCTFAWVNGLLPLIVPLPASVKGSSKAGKVQVTVRPEDSEKLNRSAYSHKDYQHIQDSYQLGRYYIVQQLAKMRK